MKKLITFIFLFFIFMASPKAYDLTIINNQNDNILNTYTYELNVFKATGAYQYTYNNTNSYLIFDATGNTTFTLKNNESITLKNLPESSYQIKQILIPNYNTYINNKQNNIFSSNTKTNNTVTFINKTTTSPNPNTATLPFILIGITIITITLLYYLKHLKVKRYQ